MIVLALSVMSAGFLYAHQALAATATDCTANPPAYGCVVSSITIPAGTATANYRIWTRMATDDSAHSSYNLEVLGSSVSTFTIGSSTTKAIPVYSGTDDTNGTRFKNDSSNWINTTAASGAGSVVSVSLPAGTTTIQLIGNAPGVVIDRVIFTQDPNCIPTGTGDNCATPADTTLPVASITSPTANQTVSNPVISVSASDNVGIDSVDIYDGATKLGAATISGSPAACGSNECSVWKYTWNTAALPAGSSHVLTAKVSDGTNTPVATAGVTVKIKDSSAPTAVTITDPDPGVTASGQVSVAATAIDNVAPTSFSFELTGPTATTVTAAPVTACAANTACAASTTVNTTGLANGQYSIVATAKDAAGNTSNPSAPVTFTVNNVVSGTDTTAPTISSISLAANSVVSTDLNITSGIGQPYDSDNYVVAVVAADNSGGSGLKQVSIQINGGAAVTLTSGFIFKLDMSNLAMNGPNCSNASTPHLLKVTATDNAGKAKTTTVPFYATKAADMNDDCHANVSDLSFLSGKWNQSGSNLGRADTNYDRVVDISDLSRLAGQYGKF